MIRNLKKMLIDESAMELAILSILEFLSCTSPRAWAFGFLCLFAMLAPFGFILDVVLCPIEVLSCLLGSLLFSLGGLLLSSLGLPLEILGKMLRK